jgi:hypothetical protein
MKSALRLIWTLTIILLSGCAPEGAPFPSSFKVTGPGQFEFVARGNWVYPANTASGEAERMLWLRGHISQHQICVAGYRIIERTPQPRTGSRRASRDKQLSLMRSRKKLCAAELGVCPKAKDLREEERQ